MAAIAQSPHTYTQLRDEQNGRSPPTAEPGPATRYREQNGAQHHDLCGLEAGESLEKVCHAKHLISLVGIFKGGDIRRETWWPFCCSDSAASYLSPDLVPALPVPILLL